MRPAARICLLVLLSQGGAQRGHAQPQTAADGLRYCLAIASRQHDKAPLSAGCPDLESKLQEAGLADYLDEASIKALDTSGLESLLAGLTRYEGNAAVRPRVDSLAGIAAEVNGPAAHREQSWTDRLKAWLSRWFAAHAPQLGGWLDTLAQKLHVSTRALHIIAYLSMTLVIILAVAVVVHELRVLGILKRPQGESGDVPQPNRAADTIVAEATRSRSVVARLLASLVARLVATGRLHSEHALTHRELVSESQFDSENQRRSFELLAISAESELYGEQALPDSEQVVRDAEGLLAELQGRA